MTGSSDKRKWKKWLAAVCLLPAVMVAGIYVFIPGELTVSTFTLVHCNANGAVRVLSEEGFWSKRQPGKGENYTYRLSGKFYNAIDLTLEKGGGKDKGGEVESKMNIFPLPHIDSIALEWSCHFKPGRNPIKRILQYEAAKAIKKDMVLVLSSLRQFLEKKENIYGIDVTDTLSRDSTLVATKLFSTAYPSTAKIYQLIGDLRKYIASEGAKETGYPMMHVERNKRMRPVGGGGGMFETMVAIPVNVRLKGNGRLFLKLFVPWKILAGETRGGPFTGEQALDRLQQYMQDYQRMPMAIPFQSLITERDKEPDTAKWITRVIQPVF